MDLIDGMFVDPAEDIGESIQRIYFIHFACTHQAVHDSDTFSPPITSGEQVIMPSDSSRPDTILYGVV